MKTNDELDRASWRGCKKKKRYKTEAEAKKKAKEYQMNFYECKYCGGWHLTSAKQFFHSNEKTLKFRKFFHLNEKT